VSKAKEVKRETEEYWNYDPQAISLCQGYMEKKGFYMHGYTKKFFVLQKDGILFHFDTEEDRDNGAPPHRSKKPITGVNLTPRKPNSIHFSFGDTGKEQEFRVVKEDVKGMTVDRTTWQTAVQNICNPPTQASSNRPPSPASSPSPRLVVRIPFGLFYVPWVWIGLSLMAVWVWMWWKTGCSSGLVLLSF